MGLLGGVSPVTRSPAVVASSDRDCVILTELMPLSDNNKQRDTRPLASRYKHTLRTRCAESKLFGNDLPAA